LLFFVYVWQYMLESPVLQGSFGTWVNAKVTPLHLHDEPDCGGDVHLGDRPQLVVVESCTTKWRTIIMERGLGGN
jgi:hypothetical protein